MREESTLAGVLFYCALQIFSHPQRAHTWAHWIDTAFELTCILNMSIFSVMSVVKPSKFGVYQQMEDMSQLPHRGGEFGEGPVLWRQIREGQERLQNTVRGREARITADFRFGAVRNDPGALEEHTIARLRHIRDTIAKLELAAVFHNQNGRSIPLEDDHNVEKALENLTA